MKEKCCVFLHSVLMDDISVVVGCLCSFLFDQFLLLVKQLNLLFFGIGDETKKEKKKRKKASYGKTTQCLVKWGGEMCVCVCGYS